MSAVAPPPLTLADLPRVRVAAVRGVDADADAAHRLVMLGFAPDTEVRFVRRAPWRGPIVVDVRGAQICLRMAQARCIRIAPLPSAPRPEAPA